MAAMEEDHLEFQLKQVNPEETLEEQFVRNKQTYLFYKLAWIQEFFDRKEARTGAGFSGYDDIHLRLYRPPWHALR